MIPSVNNPWQRLLDAGLVTGPPPEPSPPEAPWYVRLMLGAAGWLAAAFILGFVAAGMVWVIDSDTARMVAGLIMLGAAWLMLQARRAHEFVQQFALAVSFAGQTLFVFGLFGSFDHHMARAVPWLLFTILQTALTVLMPNPIHRHWSAFAASVAFLLTLQTTPLALLAPAIVLAAATVTWIHEFRWPQWAGVVRAAGYGMVIALITMDLSGGLFRMAAEIDPQSETQRLLGQLFTGAVLLGLVWVLLRRLRISLTSKTAVIVLGGTVLLILVSLEAPGIATGVCFLLLGYAHSNATLTGLGITALLLFASSFYYQMDATLLVKSQVLAFSGALMLLLRWIIAVWLNPSEETRDEDA